MIFTIYVVPKAIDVVPKAIYVVPKAIYVVPQCIYNVGNTLETLIYNVDNTLDCNLDRNKYYKIKINLFYIKKIITTLRWISSSNSRWNRSWYSGQIRSSNSRWKRKCNGFFSNRILKIILTILFNMIFRIFSRIMTV